MTANFEQQGEIQMRECYKLDGKTPVPCESLNEWAEWFETANRVVKRVRFGESMISTVFLGFDHRNPIIEGAPLIFETMIFGGERDQYQDRCSTWEEAEAMHEKAVWLAGTNRPLQASLSRLRGNHDG